MANLLSRGTQSSYYNNQNRYGEYQFISMAEVINNFTATYVGAGKLLDNTLRSDISFHAYRALQELSFDTLKSCKSQEIEVPPSLTMPLPHDYVNYVKLSWSDASGIKHVIYPTLSKTSNPKAIQQNTDGDYEVTAVGSLVLGNNDVVLDGSYPEIYTGMLITGQDLFSGRDYFVTHTSTVSDVTTITMDAVPLSTITQTLSFNPPKIGGAKPISNQLVSAVHLEGVTWTAPDHRIQAASISDAAKVSVGMIVSHEDFPIGTKVVDIQGAVITLDNDSTAASATSDNINFVNYSDDSDTWSKYKSHTPSENNTNDYQDYENDIYWPNEGRRYGLDPQHAQVNGSYYIDCHAGKIHFSSNLSGKTVILDYISDHVGTHEETMLHKFAEEAMYKWIAYGCLSAKMNIPEYIVRRYKKERFAETRKAKLRLSNIKLEEITQVLRGKSKQIKH